MSQNLDLGQHFMVDQSIIDLMLTTAKLSEDDSVLEIGLGEGILTKALVESSASSIQVVEIDRQYTFSDPKVEVVYGNVLDVFDALHFNAVVANIPYHVSEPLFIRLLSNLPKKIITVVGESFASLLQSNSIIGLIYQELYDIRLIKSIPPSSFNPPPRVNSALICLELQHESKLATFFECSKMKVKNYLLFLAENMISKRDLKNLYSELSILDKPLYTLSSDEFNVLHRFIKDHKLA